MIACFHLLRFYGGYICVHVGVYMNECGIIVELYFSNLIKMHIDIYGIPYMVYGIYVCRYICIT